MVSTRVSRPMFRALVVAIAAAIVLGVSAPASAAPSMLGFVRTPVTGSFNLWGVCYGNGRFVAVGSGGIALTSIDGASWAEVALPVSSDLTAVTYGGGRFVAVGAQGAIVSSVDGLSWVDCSPGGDSTLLAVEYAASRFVAVGMGGTVAMSTDGLQWTTRSLGTDLLRDVAYGNGVIMAVSDWGRVFTSRDGISWASQEWPVAQTTWVEFVSGRFLVHVYWLGGNYELRASQDGTNWASLTASKDPRLMAHPAVGPARLITMRADGHTFISTNAGATWTEGGTVPRNCECIAYGADVFVAVGQLGMAITSTDGSIWKTPRPAGVSTVALQSMAVGGGRYVLVGFRSVSGEQYGQDVVMASKNGIVWEPVATGGITLCRAVAYGGGKFLAVGAHGQTATSTDGYHWQRLVWPITTELNSVAYGNGTFVAAGKDGTIVTSADGVDARMHDSASKEVLSEVTYGKGQFVVVGTNGTVLTSPDGSSWTARTSGVSKQLRAITFGGSLYVAVGSTGTIVTSPDAVTWTSRVSGTDKFLSAVVYDGGEYVVVAGDRLLTSPDGIKWTTVPISLGAQAVGACTDGRRFYMFGSAGLLVTRPVMNAASGQGTDAAVVLALKIGDATLGKHARGRTTFAALDAVPVIMGGRTFLPARAVVEALGATVSWVASEQRVDIVKGSRKISLWIGKADSLVDGVSVPIDAANPDVKPFLAVSGRTMLPLRFIVENLGATVDWNPDSQAITITSSQ